MTVQLFDGAPVVAIQMPANTATKPPTKLNVIGSPTSWVANKAAAIGLTVMVFPTSVGVVRCSAITHRMKASTAADAEVDAGRPLRGAKALKHNNAPAQHAGEDQRRRAGAHADR
jgi:hypothetical protein